MTSLTRERLASVLTYCPDDGTFTWLAHRPGRRAGSLDRYGYRQVSIDGGLYLAHRLAWFWTHGEWPAGQVDHRNGIRDDNRIQNLREASVGENQQNVSKRAGATSRLLGVTWHRHARKWHAKIQHKRKQHSLGYFDTEQAAHESYLQAKASLHLFNPMIRAGAAHGPSA